MLIERTNKEVIIRLPASVNTSDLQDIVDYARYKEITSKFKVPQKTVDKLAKDINKGWWEKNIVLTSDLSKQLDKLERN